MNDDRAKETQLEIRRASLADILDLRHRILRAGLPREAANFPGDELPTSRHYGAFVLNDSQAGAVGCATFHLNQWEGEPAWQLRGMATAEQFRRRGLGRAMLALADRELPGEAAGPSLFWCNARVPAVGFYELLGWKVMSESFEIPTAGPHVRMVRRLG
jgi:GNAT superfamily N-acetyltransferase